MIIINIAQAAEDIRMAAVPDFSQPFNILIEQFYNFALGTSGLIAGIVIVVAGAKWIISGGDAGKIKEAKGMITQAFLGMALLATMVIILNAVNPVIMEQGVEIPKIGATTIASSTLEQDCDTFKNKPGQGYNGRTDCCSGCIDCAKISKTTNDGQYINKGTNEKINKIFYQYDWKISEAWPPSVCHRSPGHANGKSFDLSCSYFNDADKTIGLYRAIRNAGFTDINLEHPTSCSQYSGQVPCTVISGIGTHFHIND